MQMENHLLEKEDRFKQLIKNSFDMLVLLDSEGVQHYVSESSEKILGYKPEELIGIAVIDRMIHPEDRESTLKDFRDIIENKANGGAQYRHRHKNGSWVYLEAFGTNQLDNPLINSVVLNVRDITERKHAEQIIKENETRLRELNATKDRFFSIIAHDLKSPFNSIVGFSNLLLEQIHDQNFKEIERYATVIQESSERAMNLLMNLLEWSQAQTGKIEYNPQNIDLVTIINEVVELSNDTARQKPIAILKKLPLNLPVVADKAMINTILRNLISNGIKFTNPGGEVIISTQQKEKQLIVSVADNGVGIKKEDIDKLFRIDYSHSTIGTNKETGTGLGLLLCKELIEMQGGKIWVESEVEKGSVFSFSIPQMNKKISPIIQADELMELYKTENIIIVDVSNGNNYKENYAKKHLNKAIFVDLNTQLSDIKEDFADGGRHPLPTIEKFIETLKNIGISEESHVIIYDDINGANAAARFWWMLKSIGHKKVQVLNGGIQQAEKIGFPISSKIEIPPITKTYKADRWELPIAEISELEKNSENKNYIIIDVRENDRYRGESEPFDSIAGHIPGSINIPFSTNLNKEGMFLSPSELKIKYQDIFKDKNSENIIVHCGSGVTACHSLLAIDYAGLTIPKLYVGSWSEWSRNNKRIATEK